MSPPTRFPAHANQDVDNRCANLELCFRCAAIQLMEQWRRIEERKSKLKMLMLAAITLGGCGIWCTHFTGMTALKLTLPDGTILVVDFELGFTILSLIFPVVGVFIGLMIASKDPFFLEIEQGRRKDMLVRTLGVESAAIFPTHIWVHPVDVFSPSALTSPTCIALQIGCKLEESQNVSRCEERASWTPNQGAGNGVGSLAAVLPSSDDRCLVSRALLSLILLLERLF